MTAVGLDPHGLLSNALSRPEPHPGLLLGSTNAASSSRPRAAMTLRAVGVKDGRRSALTLRRDVARPRLDADEHRVILKLSGFNGCY